MPNKMLIDASHPEETRVVVVRGNRIEEFDFESQDKKQLRGNIYLARVTRVEPSLQAAFVEYGGNRHGFLAFSEIHPDYYQIPVADRQALLRAEEEAAQAEEDDEEESQERGRRKRRRGGKKRGSGEPTDDSARGETAAGAQSDDRSEDTPPADAAKDDAGTDSGALEAAQEEVPSETATVPDAADLDKASENGDETRTIAASVDADVVSEPLKAGAEEGSEQESHGPVDEVNGSIGEESEVESVGAEDALEEVRARRAPLRRQYKIQEVIKRRQILLVQVVKEERGNKGAALTTYLSLAGRYSVLMPNTARGGGISRKITNPQDRKRLKEIVQDLNVPKGMGVILRTAGQNRTKAEVKRDYEYLLRLWENVRNLTLQSVAPALVYEEGSLIKRSVRDLYNKDIDEIIVAGEEGYREAKDFMRMLMPSHAKVVQPYRDSAPIFARAGIEAQLDRILQPQVTLKSGGYIIINQTEALVSIDVNSGRSTKEHSIEDTALQTNLEAAEEIARQLRLRDLAGLIVIDFIDMEEPRNNRAVEKRLKECLKNDRARIQVGRISHFGLLEMSRQRIRASVLESTMKPCPHCGGTGHVRSDSSVALLVVRAIEEFLLKDSRSNIIVKTPASTALYVLNHKRGKLSELEDRFGVTITIETDESIGAQHYAIFRGAAAEKPAGWSEAAPISPAQADLEELEAIEPQDEEMEPADRAASTERAEEGDHHRKRKRRRRRRGRDRARDQAPGEREQAASSEGDHAAASDLHAGDEEAGEAESTEPAETAQEEDGQDRKKRRRGKRGGKRHRKDGAEPDAVTTASDSADAEPQHAPTEPVESPSTPEAIPELVEAVEVAPIAKPKRVRRTAKAAKAEASSEPDLKTESPQPAPDVAAPSPVETGAPEQAAEDSAPDKAQKRPTRRRSEADKGPTEPVVSSTVANDDKPEGKKSKRVGWWQRKGFF
jgi:ribonuclease E